jgi:hypothetical protein
MPLLLHTDGNYRENHNGVHRFGLPEAPGIAYITFISQYGCIARNAFNDFIGDPAHTVPSMLVTVWFCTSSEIYILA